MYKILFKIKYNDKEFLLLSAENHRITFLEVNSDGNLKYPTLEDFLELHKIYNYKDKSVVYDARKMSFSEKVFGKNKILSLVMALNIFALSFSVADTINDMHKESINREYVQRVEQLKNYGLTTDYEIQRYLLDEYFNHTIVTREDVVDAINSNEYITYKDKEIAISQLDSMLKLDPNMNLRIYYENMKTIRIERVSHEKWDSDKYTVGYYRIRENLIRVFEETDENVLCHELAHASHLYYREIDNRIFDVYESCFLTEAFTDFATKESFYNGAYYIEGKILNYFLENVHQFDFSVYNDKGFYALVDELKKLYPDVDVDYLMDVFDANMHTGATLGQCIDLKEEKEILDELFKIALSNINKSDLYDSFNSFMKIVDNDKGVYDKYIDLFNYHLLSNGYISERDYNLIYHSKSFVLSNGNIYICDSDTFYYDYDGNKKKISEDDFVFPIGKDTKELMISDSSKGKIIYTEEYINSLISSGNILFGINTEDSFDISKEDMINILDLIFDKRVENVSDYKSLQSAYSSFLFDFDYFGAGRYDREFFYRKREINSEKRYFNKYMSIAIEKGFITKEDILLANDILSIMKVDGIYYPITEIVNYPSNLYTIINNYDDNFSEVTRVIKSERLICKYITEDGSTDTIEIGNSVVKFYNISDYGRMNLEYFFSQNSGYSFTQENIKRLIDENNIANNNLYKNVFKLSNGDIIYDGKLDDSFEIEFGKEGKNITYRISKEGKIIFASTNSFNPLSSKIKLIDFLNCMNYYNDESLDKMLTQEILVNALYELKYYMPEVSFVYEYVDVEYISPDNGEKVNETIREDNIDFINPLSVIVNGNTYYARNIQAIQDYENKMLCLYLPNGEKYDICSLEGVEILDTMEFSLDEVIEHYNIDSKSNEYYFTIEELIDLFKNIAIEYYPEINSVQR